MLVKKPRFDFSRDALSKDLGASVVVFLVALPLCMGISIASGVPPALGLMTGIIGGLVVGWVTGSPLQVSGPAAGLVVLVWKLIEDYGMAGLSIAVATTGLIQLLAGILRFGPWFRAVSPSVIQGMLAGIGVLIFVSQFHVMLDDVPQSKAIDNLLSIPEAIVKGVAPEEGKTHQIAAILGLVTIFSLVLWEQFKPKKLYFIPGALIAIILVSLIAMAFSFPVLFVEIPADFSANFNFLDFSALQLFHESDFVVEIFALAFIASAETLLSASAVDHMHNGLRTDYNQELFAQGIGNMMCGLIGALPMTGVIVRSSANVEAGAKTQLSTILHGVWLLLTIVFASFVLEYIPKAGLAAILVYTGYRLFNWKNMIRIWKRGRGEFVVYVVTLGAIVIFDLLTGVLLGLVLAFIKLIHTFSNLEVEIQERGEEVHIELKGAATFLGLPRLAHKMEGLRAKKEVHIHIRSLLHIDYACLDMIQGWARTYEDQGGKVMMEWDALVDRKDRRWMTDSSELGPKDLPATPNVKGE